MLKEEDVTMKNKPIIQEKSSEKVAKFLEKNSLHKKDFAEMIGVTLSYVYNLIDDAIPFSNSRYYFRKNCNSHGNSA